MDRRGEGCGLGMGLLGLGDLWVPYWEHPPPRHPRNILGLPASRFVKSGTFQESVDLQRRVYSKLAGLTKLRELRLGYHIGTFCSYHDVTQKILWRQYDCLAMTVLSGLDLLKGLKGLRAVGLEDMEVYVEGDREESWFAEHWPHAIIGVSY